MQDVIKKYFWIVGLLTLLICAGLAAQAANNVIAGKYLNDRDTASVVESKKSASAIPVRRSRSKSGSPLAQRNMFCSECAPEESKAKPVTDSSDPMAVPFTSLPLKLVATNVGSREQYSFATIFNTDSQSQGAYWKTDTIPGAGKVIKIAGKYVDFHSEENNRTERISLLSDTPIRRKPKTSTKTASAPKSNSKKDELTAMLDEGIKKNGENSYEIDRNLVDKVLANPMSVARGARIVPSVKNGKANGFKLYAIRPSSVYAKIGLRNGDTIHAINGFELTTPDKALEVYTKVKESNNLSVSVTRRGKPVNLDYSIR